MPRKKTTRSSAAGQGTIAVDDDGDLKLVVGSGAEQTTFLVCSRTLSRSSPVFKAMLYGSFRESRPADPAAKPWVVELPDDSKVSAAILLDIVHGRFNMVPSKDITLDILYDILVFADKYDMTSLLHPWTQAWVSSLSPLHVPPTTPCSWSPWKAIVVSRELGAKDTLEKLVELTVMGTEVNSKGELLWEGEPIEFAGSQEMPLSSAEIFQHAAKLRLGLLKQLFDCLQTTVVRLQEAIYKKSPRYCNDYYGGWDSEPVKCQSATLGSIIAALGHTELKVIWAGPALTLDALMLYPCSVKHLMEKMRKIAMREIPVNGPPSEQYYHSEDCHPLSPKAMARMEEKLWHGAGSFLTDETLAHLNRQRTKFGDLDVSSKSK